MILQGTFSELRSVHLGYIDNQSATHVKYGNLEENEKNLADIDIALSEIQVKKLPTL